MCVTLHTYTQDSLCLTINNLCITGVGIRIYSNIHRKFLPLGYVCVKQILFYNKSFTHYQQALNVTVFLVTHGQINLKFSQRCRESVHMYYLVCMCVVYYASMYQCIRMQLYVHCMPSRVSLNLLSNIQYAYNMYVYRFYAYILCIFEYIVIPHCSMNQTCHPVWG